MLTQWSHTSPSQGSNTQWDRTSTESPGFTPQPVTTNRSSLRPRRQEMDVTFRELLASWPSPAWCPVPGTGPVPVCPPGAPARPFSPAGPVDPIQGQGINQFLRVIGQTGRVVPAPPPPPCHARTKQDGEDAAEPQDGDGDGDGGRPGGVGVTRLTPEDVTKGDRRWRTGTYREGGSSTEADLLHGVEEEAAGSHASLAPRLGEGRLGLQAVDPRPQLGPASLPGRGPGPAAVGARIRLPPSLRPSFFPSFPPSSASRASGIPASLPRAGTKVPVREQDTGWSQLKCEGLGWGEAFPPQGEAAMHPQTKGLSILLPPRSYSPKRGTWDPLPWGQRRGRTPCLHLGGLANSPQGGNPKMERIPRQLSWKSPGGSRTAGASHPFTLTEVSRSVWGN